MLFGCSVILLPSHVPPFRGIPIIPPVFRCSTSFPVFCQRSGVPPVVRVPVFLVFSMPFQCLLEMKEGVSVDWLPIAYWLTDWAWNNELRQCCWFLQASKQTRAEICPKTKEKACRNHCHGTCSHIETNNTKLCPTSAYLVSTKHKKIIASVEKVLPKKG